MKFYTTRLGPVPEDIIKIYNVSGLEDWILGDDCVDYGYKKNLQLSLQRVESGYELKYGYQVIGVTAEVCGELTPYELELQYVD